MRVNAGPSRHSPNHAKCRGSCRWPKHRRSRRKTSKAGEAYEAGAELADNPYRAGTDAHSRWVWGWRDASEHV